MGIEIAAVAEPVLSLAEGLLRNDRSGLFSSLYILRIRSGAHNDLLRQDVFNRALEVLSMSPAWSLPGWNLGADVFAP